jgi:hypothetical protein
MSNYWYILILTQKRRSLYRYLKYNSQTLIATIARR